VVSCDSGLLVGFNWPISMIAVWAFKLPAQFPTGLVFNLFVIVFICLQISSQPTRSYDEDFVEGVFQNFTTKNHQDHEN